MGEGGITGVKKVITIRLKSVRQIRKWIIRTQKHLLQYGRMGALWYQNGYRGYQPTQN